jgi:hypothetical protein
VSTLSCEGHPMKPVKNTHSGFYIEINEAIPHIPDGRWHFKCLLCDRATLTYSVMRWHLRKCHNIPIAEEEYQWHQISG